MSVGLIQRVLNQKKAYDASNSALATATTDEQTRGAGYDADAAASKARFTDFLGSGEDSLNKYISGAISAGMPQLNANLQTTRENEISRGVGLGGLGTSYEGDVYSAFQKNIANAAAGQAMNLYNTQEQGYGNLYGNDVQLAEGSRNRYLDLLTGNADRLQAQANARNASKFLGIF